jgi:hypothetical protein
MRGRSPGAACPTVNNAQPPITSTHVAPRRFLPGRFGAARVLAVPVTTFPKMMRRCDPALLRRFDRVDVYVGPHADAPACHRRASVTCDAWRDAQWAPCRERLEHSIADAMLYAYSMAMGPMAIGPRGARGAAMRVSKRLLSSRAPILCAHAAAAAAVGRVLCDDTRQLDERAWVREVRDRPRRGLASEAESRSSREDGVADVNASS